MLVLSHIKIKDLSSATFEPQDKMHSGPIDNVVVGQSLFIFHLPSSKYQTLLAMGNLVHSLVQELEVADSVVWTNLKLRSRAGRRLDEDIEWIANDNDLWGSNLGNLGLVLLAWGRIVVLEEGASFFEDSLVHLPRLKRTHDVSVPLIRHTE